jgi:beta-lactam-binding protein with PASTA domain
MTEESPARSPRSRHLIVLVILLALLVGVGIGVLVGSRSGDDGSAGGAAVESTTTTTSVDVTSTLAPATDGSSVPAAGSGSVPAGGGGGGGAPVPAQQFVVPDLVGKPVGVAESLLAAQGLRSLYAVVNDWRVAADVVVSQDQAPGTVLVRDAVVSFRVSSGPELAPVPNVVGQCVSAARDRLTAAGFTPQVFYRADGAVKYYRVISSTPAGSLLQMQGTVVTLYVSTNPSRDGCS